MTRTVTIDEAPEPLSCCICRDEMIAQSDPHISGEISTWKRLQQQHGCLQAMCPSCLLTSLKEAPASPRCPLCRAPLCGYCQHLLEDSQRFVTEEQICLPQHEELKNPGCLIAASHDNPDELKRWVQSECPGPFRFPDRSKAQHRDRNTRGQAESQTSNPEYYIAAGCICLITLSSIAINMSIILR